MKLYILLWRRKGGKWQFGGTAETEEDREWLLKSIRLDGLGFEYGYVEGPIVSPETMEQAAVRLGEFV